MHGIIMKKAFSIIEIMVVIVMMLLVLGLVWGSIFLETPPIEKQIINGNITDVKPVAAEDGQFLFITFKDGRVIRFFYESL